MKNFEKELDAAIKRALHESDDFSHRTYAKIAEVLAQKLAKVKADGESERLSDMYGGMSQFG
jgi:hypothetical protein